MPSARPSFIWPTAASCLLYPPLQCLSTYLLAAETFAEGRLTNPTPAMWTHFETFHELMEPTYMSVYPPGQGAALALGRVLFGHPWWSVWLTLGLMCAALTWMLYEWLPAAWALLGGVLAVLQFRIAHYWMNSYS